jgi:hypothetical protein
MPLQALKDNGDGLVLGKAVDPELFFTVTTSSGDSLTQLRVKGPAVHFDGFRDAD